jgi:hypothetical protein
MTRYWAYLLLFLAIGAVVVGVLRACGIEPA